MKTKTAPKTAGVAPFLKWAGGKRWLTSNHPDAFPTSYERYIEPFLGSGAVFFHLQPRRGILADKNVGLIGSYKAIRDGWKDVQKSLREHANKHSEDHYYAERSRRRRVDHKQAAQLIYLNRTCWNGLYRVNRQGQFNVPIGTKDSVILPTDDFEKTARLLKNMQILASDFERIIDKATVGDFLFVDPPYTVKHNMNGFIKYNEQMFSWGGQVRLRDSLVRASSRGALITMTNADHESIRELYSDFMIMTPLPRHTILAGKATARTKTTELLIKNWD